METQKINKYLIFILLIVLAVLASAFIIEYVLDFKPCNLCIYQRIPYIISIFLITRMLFFEKNKKIILLILALIFFISAFLAFYHFGIEKGFFSESIVCKNKDVADALSKEKILEQLENSKISCKKINFRILGFSLATINLILSLILSAIFYKLWKKQIKKL